jgi:hypothetical protein
MRIWQTRIVNLMNSENFYIVATDPDEPALKVNISGPYLTCNAAEADLQAAIDEACGLDPCARQYSYSICKLACQKPGVIQHMACNAAQQQR